MHIGVVCKSTYHRSSRMRAEVYHFYLHILLRKEKKKKNDHLFNAAPHEDGS